MTQKKNQYDLPLDESEIDAEEEFKKIQNDMREMQKLMAEKDYKEDSLEVSIDPARNLQETPEGVNQSYGQEISSVATPDVDYTIN